MLLEKMDILGKKYSAESYPRCSRWGVGPEDLIFWGECITFEELTQEFRPVWRVPPKFFLGVGGLRGCINPCSAIFEMGIHFLLLWLFQILNFVTIRGVVVSDALGGSDSILVARCSMEPKSCIAHYHARQYQAALKHCNKMFSL